MNKQRERIGSHEGLRSFLLGQDYRASYLIILEVMFGDSSQLLSVGEWMVSRKSHRRRLLEVVQESHCNFPQ